MNKLTVIPLMLLLASCSITRNLPEGEYILAKTKVEVNDDSDVDRAIKKELNNIADQQKNREVLGLFPVRAWLYQLAGDSVPDRGIRHWLKTKVGEPPVMYRKYAVAPVQDKMEQVMKNKGYFNGNANSVTNTRGRKASVIYHIDPGSAYVINEVHYPAPVDTLTAIIDSMKKGSLLVTGKQFDLEKLKAERERIGDDLKTRGYFYFLPEFLYYRLDTTPGTTGVEVTLALKNEMPPQAAHPCYLERVIVYHDTTGSAGNSPDTLMVNGLVHIYEGDMNVEESIISASVFLKAGKRYDPDNYSKTFQALNHLGVFKTVRIRMSEARSGKPDKLDAHIRLVEAKPRSIRAEFSAVSKSNDFTGPGLDLSYKNRNVGREAAAFDFSLNSGFETQLVSKGAGLNNFQVGSDVAYSIPRIIIPGAASGRFSSLTGRSSTGLRAGYSHYNRSSLYTVNTLNFCLDYSWKGSPGINHEFKLISLDYQGLNNVSDRPEVADFLNRNYPRQFISAMRYTFTMNKLPEAGLINHYFSFSAEPAGNLLALADQLLVKQVSSEDVSAVMGIPYAQFGRLFADYRLYIGRKDRNRLVGRTFIGLGIPYGNSEKLPLNRQFYAGGSSGLRAFPSRSVGPGTYNEPDSLLTGIQLGQTGDIKLEVNLEYRHGFTQYLKGALFVDAGNIWLFNEDSTLPGGKFSLAGFPSQLAVGTGAGLRVDVSFVVLRLDVAMPLRKPYLQPGDRWVINQIDFGDRNWRRDNIVFNLAIGYPF